MLVTLIIPALRWDSFLEATLRSVFSQRLPDGVDLEVVVGLAEPAPQSPPTGVTIVHNESGTIPDALNLAIAASRGDIIVRVDSRCDLSPNHVRRVVDRLADDGTGCVGGAQLVLDRGVFGSAYAIAFNSPLLGPSVYRYGRRSGPIASPYLGAWRRSVLVAVGGFDPNLRRNQDNELAERVRSSGLGVWYDADLVVGYTNNRTLRSAMAHHHDFGAWRMVQHSRGQRSLSLRHVTAIAVLGAGGAAAVTLAALPRTRAATAATTVAGYLTAAAWGRWCATRLRQARPDIDVAAFHPVGVLLSPAVALLIDAAWLAGVVEGFLNPEGIVRRTG